ncbi:hypothetical protein AK812_SmicGene16497 [Symbiodinium microadriaticum]|uniref:Uncharacterized protein n=1 Tax=Symbiodinium microadriaticum TaxID=2951 RepID=A0A1Q9E060_SYMMI|nr:hypothetical protein AK812_SmicGene16497 [Symbiodinium microadriaticum]
MSDQSLVQCEDTKEEDEEEEEAEEEEEQRGDGQLFWLTALSLRATLETQGVDVEAPIRERPDARLIG